MTGGDQTPPGSGLPDPEGAVAPRAWGPTPRRWIPGDTWAGAARVSNAPAARRSALTPLPEEDERASAPRRSAMSPTEQDDAPASRARRSAMSPGEDDDDFDSVVPRRSALSPLPSEDAPAAVARRSAFTPTEPEDAPTPRRSAWVEEDDDEDEGYEETLRLPLPRYSSEYATAARAIQPALPELGPTPDSAPSPVRAFSPVEPPSPVTDAVSPFSPSVQPVLPDPALADPIEAEPATTDLPVVAAVTFVEGHVSAVGPVAASVAHEVPSVTVPQTTMAAAAVAAAEDRIMPDIAELPAAVTEKQELLAEEEEMLSEGGHVAEDDSASVGDDTATWLFGSALLSDADHSLYRRPAPGEPETEVDLTPIIIDDPEYDVRKGTSPSAKSTPRPNRPTRTKPSRGASARRVHVAWRDHKRLLLISSIVLALLLVVGGGGYLLSRYNPTMAALTEGNLTLPLTAGTFQRDPAQGATPSADPISKIQTVSATYSLNGTQEFVAIAYRPQTDSTAALNEIQASGIVKVDGGACGRTSDQNRMACAVVSGTTAVLLLTLVDQSADELIAAAQSVASGIGKT